LGNPSGVIRIDEFRTGLIYGKSCLFVFRKEKFQQFVKNENLVSPASSLPVEVHPLFDRSNWILVADKKEIKNRAKYQDVDPDSTPTYRYSIGTDVFSADLMFTSSSSSSSTDPKTYTLYSVDIKFNEPLAPVPPPVP